MPEKVITDLQPSKMETRIFQFVVPNMESDAGIIHTSNRLLIIALKLLIIDRLRDRLSFFGKYMHELILPGIPRIKVRYSVSKPKLAKLYQFLHPFILVYEGVLWGFQILDLV